MRTLPPCRQSVFEAYHFDQKAFFCTLDRALHAELPRQEAKNISACIQKNFSTWVKRAEHSAGTIYVARKTETGLARTIRISLHSTDAPELQVVLKNLADGSVKRLKKILVINRASSSKVAEVGILKACIRGKKKTLRQGKLDEEIEFMNTLSRLFSFLSSYKNIRVPDKKGILRNKYHTELADEDLQDHILSPSWLNEPFEKKLELIARLSSMVLALHKAGFCHLDIKEKNVLLFSDGSVRLSDFGLAAKIGTKVFYKGTSGYIAPEMAKRYDVGAQPSMDMWSLGVVLWNIFKKDKDPFYGVQNNILNKMRQGFRYSLGSLIDKIKQVRKELAGPEDNALLKRVYKLIARLFHVDPRERLTDKELVKRLNKIQASTNPLSHCPRL